MSERPYVVTSRCYGRAVGDDTTLERVLTDFGGMIRRRPAAVLVPRVAADMATVHRVEPEVRRTAKAGYDLAGLLNRGQGILP
jgi:hypothetical protein